MATYIEELAALTNATTALLSAVNVKKVTLDAAVEDAVAAAALALTHANAEVARAAAQADIATEKAVSAGASSALSVNSANLAASNVQAQLTTVKTQTEAARDQALAGLGAADQSQNLVLLMAGLQHALDVAGKAADWPLNVARAEALLAAVCVALDLAGVTAKQVNGGVVQLAAGTPAEPALWPVADRNTGLYFPAADAVALVTAGLERLRLDASGNLGIGTNAPSGLLDVNDNRLRVRTAKTPASATAAGNAGEFCWDASFVYVAVGTNQWKRAALTVW